MPRIPSVLLLASLAFAAAACATPPQLRLIPRVTRFEVDGDFGAADSGGSISSKSDASALGLDDEDAITPQIELDFAAFHISAHHTGASFRGDGRTESTLRFRGEEIAADSEVRSEFDVALLAADIVYDVVQTNVVDVGVGVGAGAFTYDLSVRTTSGPDASVESDETVPIGYLVVRVGTAPGAGLRFVGYARGLTGTLQDDEATYLDLDGRLSLDIWSVGPASFAVCGGYRYILVDYKHDGSDGKLEIDVSISGPYVGIEIVF